MRAGRARAMIVTSAVIAINRLRSSAVKDFHRFLVDKKYLRIQDRPREALLLPAVPLRVSAATGNFRHERRNKLVNFSRSQVLWLNDLRKHRAAEVCVLKFNNFYLATVSFHCIDIKQSN